MKVSTKGRYGLRALGDLAYHSNNSAISLISIAQRQNISLNYLEQVFAILRKAGIVKSIKGSQGGYMLADVPEKIKVGDVLSALEGKFNIVDEAVKQEEMDPIQKAINSLIWEKINKNVNEMLYSSTIADLTEEYAKLNDTVKLGGKTYE